MAGKNTVQKVEEIVAPFASELSVSIWDITFTKEGTDWDLRIFIAILYGTYIYSVRAVF